MNASFLKWVDIQKNFKKELTLYRKTVRAPFTSVITPATNKELQLALNEPIINEQTVPDAKIRRAAQLIREELDGLLDYARNAKFILDINDGQGGTFKGKNVGFNPGYIKGYFPTNYLYKKMRDNPNFGQQNLQTCFNEMDLQKKKQLKLNKV